MVADDAFSVQGKLQRWVNDSGRALEMRTARAFTASAQDRRVQLSRPYLDPTTNELRETDVFVTYRWQAEGLRCRLDVVVECKAPSGEHWVAFFDEDSRVRQPITSALNYLATAPWLAGAAFLEQNSGPHEFDAFAAAMPDPVKRWCQSAPFTSTIAAHIVEANLARRIDEKTDGRNRANDAIRQAASAAVAESKDSQRIAKQTERQDHQQDWYGVLAVVVTTAHLYECQLLPDASVKFLPVPRVVVHGHVGSTRGAHAVFVVTDDHLDQLVRDLDTCLAQDASAP